MAKKYLLKAANGVKRTFWYNWDLAAPIADTYLVETDLVTLRQAGRSFRTVQQWMLGFTVKGCAVDADGT